jgi:proteasome lid subunit RPN8/RPN11
MEQEKRCMRVRKGDKEETERLIDDFHAGEKDSKLLDIIFGKKNVAGIPAVDLLPAHEAYLTRGRPRESIEPLKMLLETGGVKREMRSVVLSRAAQTAIREDLPLDLRPILSELGLRRRSASDSLKSFRERRRRKEGAVALMDRNLLSSLMAMENAGMVESESMRRDLLLSADSWMREAYQIAMRNEKMSNGDEKEVWLYHLARVKHMAGNLLLDIGDPDGGLKFLEGSLTISERSGFKHLTILNLISISSALDDDESAISLAGRGAELSGEIGNPDAEARCLHNWGYRTCLIGEAKGNMQKIKDGTDLLLEASERAHGENNRVQEGEYLAEGALWLIRAGEPKKALINLRKASGMIKRDDDEELFIRIKCVYVLGLFRSGKSRKAKRSLLDLISHYPVKHYASCYNVLKEAVEEEDWLKEDPDTSKLFEGETGYSIEKDAVDEIIERAKEAYPNEFGAMLRGVEHITHIEPVLEGAGGRTSFVFSLFSRFSQREVPGEGVVHSHPSGSARPSRADLSMFGRFPGINIIIAYPYTPESMAAYDRLGNRVKLDIV